jgi:hypothetical protein
VNASTSRPPTTAAARAGRGSSAPAPAPTSGPFAALPHALRKDPRLRGRDKAVLLAAALLEYARGKPSCWPGNRRLADDLACCPRTVQLALKALQAAGWVRVELGGGTPTGRRIVLAWREADCAPPATSVAPPPPVSVAPEGRREGERQRPSSAAGCESPPPPADNEGREPDLATLRQWADGPDPILRRIAGKRLAKLAAEAGASVEPVAVVEPVAPPPAPAPASPVVPGSAASATRLKPTGSPERAMARPYSPGVPKPGDARAGRQGRETRRGAELAMPMPMVTALAAWLARRAP